MNSEKPAYKFRWGEDLKPFINAERYEERCMNEATSGYGPSVENWRVVWRTAVLGLYNIALIGVTAIGAIKGLEFLMSK